MNEAIRPVQVVYVSGPISDKRGVYYYEQNMQEAKQVALELWKNGFAVICPHMNTFALDGAVEYEQFMRGDLEFVARSDLLVLLETWRRSPGATREGMHARRLGKPILQAGSGIFDSVVWGKTRLQDILWEEHPAVLDLDKLLKEAL